jgi:hypothetical protein
LAQLAVRWWNLQCRCPGKRVHRPLTARRAPQDAREAALASVQASLRAALSRLPLVNGATAGPRAAAPDVAALQAVLARGGEAMARLRPALQRLIGDAGQQQAQEQQQQQQLLDRPNRPGSTVVRGIGAPGIGDQEQQPQLQRSHNPHDPQQQQRQQNAAGDGSASGTAGPAGGAGRAPSVATTAAYARELIDLACDSVARLGGIRCRLEQLADAALYANSMEAQLAQMAPARRA